MDKREATRVAADITAAEIGAYLDAPGHIQEVIDGNWTEADHDRVEAALQKLRREMWVRAGRIPRPPRRRRFFAAPLPRR